MSAVTSDQSPHFDVRCYGPAAGVGLAHRIWPCYDEVFGDFDDFETWHADMFARHATRNGYRLVVATQGTAVAGFSWGYIGERGQYWADLVVGALPGRVADEWVGAHFEFVELPSHRSTGAAGSAVDCMTPCSPASAKRLC